MTKPTNSSFPQKEESAFPYDHYNIKPQQGLTKREYFAGLAMQGLLANPNTTATNPTVRKEMAWRAVRCAYALIAELKETKSMEDAND